MKREGQAPNQLAIDFRNDNKINITDTIDGDNSYDIDLEQFDAAGKKGKIQLNDVGKGDKGANNYQIEVDEWDGGSKIPVKHDKDGNGFDDDAEVMVNNEKNDITDDPNKEDDGGLMSYLYSSLGW